jgi:hypothetical protein
MKEILSYLFDYKTLTKDDAKEVLTNFSSGILQLRNYRDSGMPYLICAFPWICLISIQLMYVVQEVMGKAPSIFQRLLLSLWLGQERKYLSMETIVFLQVAGHQM